MGIIRNLLFTIIAILFFEIVMWAIKSICVLITLVDVGWAISICLFGIGIVPMLVMFLVGYLLSLIYKIAKSMTYAYWTSLVLGIGYAIYYLISVWVSWASLDISVIYPILITILFVSGAWAVLAAVSSARDFDS